MTNVGDGGGKGKDTRWFCQELFRGPFMCECSAYLRDLAVAFDARFPDLNLPQVVGNDDPVISIQRH